MLRLIALAALVLAANPALALTDAELIAKQYETRKICRIPDEAVTIEQSDKACEDAKVLVGQLVAKGYCFDRSEQEWRKCQ